MTIVHKETTETERSLINTLRPIRLALKVAESLLSHGVSTRDTVNQALDITERYCKEKVYFDVSSNVITASQYRGLDKDPLTLVVTVRYATTNNMLVQELQQLVRDIVKGLPLNDAVKRYNNIEKNTRQYPSWLRTFGNAGMATGLVMIYASSWVNLVLSFITACIVDRIMLIIARRKVPTFFVQVIGSFAIVLGATGFAALGKLGIWPFIHVDPTLVTVGVIVMLVAGLTLAATAQDAIDEYYVTASARLMKTTMLTVGIVIGIVSGLGIIGQFSDIVVTTAKSLPPSPYLVQLAGAALTAVSWAVYTQSSRAAIAWAGIISVAGYALYAAISPAGAAIANGVASFLIGFSASIVARFSRSPSIAIINAAIVILVPGFMLYRGLMHFVGTVNMNDFTQGSMTVISAVTIAIAISAGAAIGTSFGRPVRSRLIRVYRYVPSVLTNVRSHTKKRS